MKQAKGKKAAEKSIALNDLIDESDSKKVIAEIKRMVLLIEQDVNQAFLGQLLDDTVALFRGRYPGYRASTAKYHDLGHTLAVALAMARLMHGCFLKGYRFDPVNITLGIAAALFHDVGYIQSREDLEGSGAKYTVGHELRSIAFMKRYLSEKNFTPQEVKNCGHIIKCTIMDLTPETIPFYSGEIKVLGQCVGSADLMAQMADRLYLEKLLLLFKEFEEAALPGFDSEVELLRKTEGFYEAIAQKRLKKDLGKIYLNMRLHFIHRWKIDQDLYEAAIAKNVFYIKYLNNLCKKNFDCYLKNLRRGGVVEEIFGCKQ